MLNGREKLAFEKGLPFGVVLGLAAGTLSTALTINYFMIALCVAMGVGTLPLFARVLPKPVRIPVRDQSDKRNGGARSRSGKSWI